MTETQPQLEITKDLEELAERLDDPGFVAILNLPDVNLCDKRAEFVQRDGVLEQACMGCVSQFIKIRSMISTEQVHEAIDYFAENYGTRWISVNGRGDPFHPFLVDRTLDKVTYTASKGIGSYVFYPGTDVGQDVYQTLADNGANVMISLLGNDFIEGDFCEGREYRTPVEELNGLLRESANPEKLERLLKKGLVQDKTQIARSIRELIRTYREHPNQPEDGTTRLGMNYVVSEKDLADSGRKISYLKEMANRNGIAFFCNNDFESHQDTETQRRLVETARRFSSHSTSVRGQCQMGAGSSVVVDHNGGMPRCPYQSEEGNPSFFKVPGTTDTDPMYRQLLDNQRRRIIYNHLTNRGYSCVVRGTLLSK